jgi:hypothetical protein
MATIAERQEAATVKLESATAIMNSVANGGPTVVVQTLGGSVPSVTKWFADLDESVEDIASVPARVGALEASFATISPDVAALKSWRPNAVTVVSNLAALKSLDAASNPTAFRQGYAAAGDGGASYWRYSAGSTATANDVTVVATASGTGRWLLTMSGAYDVRIGGVIPGGGNVTARAQAVYNSLPGGSAVYWPGGEYLLTNAIYISGKSFLTYGDGIDITVIRVQGTTDGFNATSASNTSTPIQRWQFQDMTIAKDGTGGYGISAVRTVLASNPSIPSLIVRNILTRGYSDIAAQYWLRGLYEKNHGAVTIENFSSIGNGDGVDTGIFLDNDPNAARYNITLRGINIQGGLNGVTVKGHCENLRIWDYEVVGSKINFLIDGTGSQIPGGINPVVIIGNGHANCKINNVKAINWKVIFIEGADMYSGVGFADEDGANIMVVNGSFFSMAGGKLGTGVVNKARQGISLINVTDSTITSNFEFFTAGGVVASGTTSKRLTITGCNFRGYPPSKMSSGIYVGDTGCTTVISANNFSDCVNAIQGLGGGSMIGPNNMIDCTNGVVWSAGDYTVSQQNFRGVTTPYTLSGTNIHKSIIVPVTFDPASVAANSRATSLVNVPGATVGDIVTLSAPYDVQDMTVTANVQNAGIVGVYFKNDTGGAKDLASGTWKFKLES